MGMAESRHDDIAGLQRVLTALGLWDTYRALPQDLREQIRGNRRPRLRVDWGWDGPRTARDRAAKALVERVISRVPTLLDDARGLALVHCGGRDTGQRHALSRTPHRS